MQYFKVQIGFEVDYIKKKFIFKFNTVGDIISAIGGINAFINPILGYFTIAFIVGFLV